MFSLLAIILLAVGIPLALSGRKNLRSGQTLRGRRLMVLGVFLAILGLLILLVIFAFYFQPLNPNM
jgi:hypothetical protein